jgi:hypothetical protein
VDQHPLATAAAKDNDIDMNYRSNACDSDLLDRMLGQRDAALTVLCLVYVAAATALGPPGAALPPEAIVLVALPLGAAFLAEVDARSRTQWSALLRVCWPLLAAPAAYLAEVHILELERGRYIDAMLAGVDQWLGLYRGGQPIWSTTGLPEELANALYASYYLIPFVVLWLAATRGMMEAARATTALVLASLACGCIWLVFPSGGYFLGGSPQDGSSSFFTALVHGLYAQHPHFAAAFPSEHVAHAVALAGVLRRERGAWIWLWPLGIAVATVLGQYHFAADGFGGWIVGFGAAAWVQYGPVTASGARAAFSPSMAEVG